MRLLMMGTGGFAEPTFQALLASPHTVVGLVTNPDRPSGREREMVRHIKQIAVDHSVPVFQPASVNEPPGVAGVRAFGADLLVVAAYGQILSREVLEAAPRGGINVHASLLPRYRGAAPIAWAIYHGEKETGVTIIRMSTALDAGDMLAQEALPILPHETAGELEARLAPLGARLALSVIAQLDQGGLQGKKQDPALVTKAPKLKKEHGLIDWTRTADQVANQVRAMQPWPTAYTYWHRPGVAPARLLLVRVQAEGGGASSAPPGAIVDVGPDRLLVQAGLGLVRVLRLQPAGKRELVVDEFLRGHRVAVGDRLGSETPPPA